MKDLESLYLQLKQRVDELSSELSSTHLTLETIVSHFSHGLLFLDTSGIIQLFNPLLSKITGIESKESLGKHYTDFFDELFFGFSIQDALASERKNYLALTTFSQGGNTYNVEITGTKIEMMGLLLLIQDCSERKRLERAVQHNERLAALGEMGATLAHEIRNPLAGIQGFASLLKEELSDERHLKQLDYIIQGTKTLNTLVTNVLEYARPLSLNFKRLNLIDVLDQARFLYGGECHVKSHSTKVWISGDQERLCLAFLNLFRNSQEAGSPLVEVDVLRSGEVKVKDQGCGINQENQTKIFSPFFTTKTTGTGLGLPEARKVIQAHGGEISIESSTPSQGTTFKIALPKAE
jgi:two-component system, NtrC family, sensor histidine kinase AtoS